MLLSPNDSRKKSLHYIFGAKSSRGSKSNLSNWKRKHKVSSKCSNSYISPSSMVMLVMTIDVASIEIRLVQMTLDNRCAH